MNTDTSAMMAVFLGVIALMSLIWSGETEEEGVAWMLVVFAVITLIIAGLLFYHSFNGMDGLNALY